MTIEAIAALFGLTCTGWQAVGDGVVITLLEDCIELEICLEGWRKPKLYYYPRTCGGIQLMKARLYVTTGSLCTSPGWAFV